MSSKNRGQIIMLATALLWSTSGVAIKLIGWNAFLIAGSRSLLASVVLLLMMKKDNLRTIVCRETIITGLAVMMTLLTFVVANKMTASANVIVLQYTGPIWIMIIETLFYKQHIKKTQIGIVFIIFCGVVLFFIGDLEKGTIAGNFIAILSGVAMAINYTLNGHLSEEKRMTSLFLGHLMAAIVGVLVGLTIIGGVHNFETTNNEVLTMLYLGIIQMGLSYYLYGKASAVISPLTVSLIGMTQCLFNPVWVAIIYREIPGELAIIGAIVIIAALAFHIVWDAKQIRNNEER